MPSGTLAGSTAIDRSGTSATPCEPRGPSAGSGSGSSRKNTTRGLAASICDTRCGLRRAQSRIAGQDASPARSSPWSISQRPTDT